MPKLEPYSKKLPYSYALGAFPSLTLLEARPDAVFYNAQTWKIYG